MEGREIDKETSDPQVQPVVSSCRVAAEPPESKSSNRVANTGRRTQVLEVSQGVHEVLVLTRHERSQANAASQPYENEDRNQQPF